MSHGKPNILYINSHDTGRHVSPHGHAVETPNIQRLAEEGVFFRNNFCVSPTCSPSRAALLTGCYPHENGMTGLAHRGWSLNDYGRHLARVLGENGYRTALAGFQHLAAPRPGGPEPWRVIGYDLFLGALSGDKPPEQAAAAFLENQPEEPFYLEVGFGETHRVFPEIGEGEGDSLLDPRYCLPPDPLPDNPATRLDMARFRISARNLDRKIGVVFDALARSGLAGNTLVICTTDHGIAFPRMKCTLFDSGIGVMLIMRGPGFSGGRAVDAMTSHLDIFPTVCEMAGISRPGWLRGRSLLPLAAGRQEEIHDALFFEVNYHSSIEPMRAARTGRWKYIRRFDGRDRPVMPHCDRGESRQSWLENGWRERRVDEECLFDLVFDPNECDNLAREPGCRAVLEDMRRRLSRWMEETGDPLLSGPVPRPDGARLEDPDA